jgi:hypothetical protein
VILVTGSDWTGSKGDCKNFDVPRSECSLYFVCAFLSSLLILEASHKQAYSKDHSSSQLNNPTRGFALHSPWKVCSRHALDIEIYVEGNVDVEGNVGGLEKILAVYRK